MPTAIEALDARNAAVKAAQERAGREAAELTNSVREHIARDYVRSEQGAARAQQVEAERIMRLPTPEALEAMGSVVGDPNKGPSS